MLQKKMHLYPKKNIVLSLLFIGIIPATVFHYLVYWDGAKCILFYLIKPFLIQSTTNKSTE